MYFFSPLFVAKRGAIILVKNTFLSLSLSFFQEGEPVSYYSTGAEDRRVEKGQRVKHADCLERQNFSNVTNSTQSTCK